MCENMDQAEFFCVEYESGNLYFSGAIDMESAHTLATFLRQVEQEKAELADKTVNLYLTSDGGSLHDALKLHDIMKNSPLNIIVTAEGWVASSATLLLCAAKKARITKHSYLLLHEFNSSSATNYSNLEGYMKHLDHLMTSVLGIYNSKLKEPISKEHICRDWFLGAYEALDLGLVDEVV